MMKLSIIIPTYNEKLNVIYLIKKIEFALKKHKLDSEIIFVDDNSPDGTGRILNELKKQYSNLKVINRLQKKSLSSAVIQGWKNAKGSIFCVMDADLSHDPEKIIELYNPIINNEAELTIGSRYVKYGRIEGFGITRKVMSKAGVFLGRLFTDVKDPMSGFFMIKKGYALNTKLNPKGFKILLELIIKSKPKRIKEIPITFTSRKKGKSKIGITEIFIMLYNVIRYLPHLKCINNNNNKSKIM